jgi:hypothetical protein
MTKFRPSVVSKLQEEPCQLTALSTEVFWPLHNEFLALETRLPSYDEKLAAMGRAHRRERHTPLSKWTTPTPLRKADQR